MSQHHFRCPCPNTPDPHCVCQEGWNTGADQCSRLVPRQPKFAPGDPVTDSRNPDKEFTVVSYDEWCSPFLCREKNLPFFYVIQSGQTVFRSVVESRLTLRSIP